jgi:putative ABC transport system permease protein
MTPQFSRIFWCHVVRHIRRHRLLAVLNVLSVALGIAVYLAIQIANHSANRSFGAAIELVAGKAHLEVRGAVNETLWPLLAKQPGIKAATGLVEGLVTLPDFPGEYLRILGVDVFSGEPFRTFALNGENGRLDLESWLSTGNGLAVTPEFARKCGVHSGEQLRVLVNGEVHTLTVLGFMRADDSPSAAQSHFAVMDIGWAQELFRTQGRLSAVQLQLDVPAHAPAVATELNRLLPSDLRAEPPRQRSYQLQNLLSAFQLNLTALSTVSLLVGVFLIYNTVSASVVRRRVEIGILRSLGTTRFEVRCLFLGEACLYGILGIAVGIAGGITLAQMLVGTVARTISSLYILLSVERTVLHPWQFISAAALGFVAVLVGAWVPASEAVRSDPVGALSMGAHAERSMARRCRWPWRGFAALGVAAVLACGALYGGPPVLGFVAAFFVLAGFSLFASASTLALGKAAARAMPDRLWWRLAADNLWRAVSRNAVTVAALSAAVAMVVGLTVMIFSFRQSLDVWINRGLVADLFIGPAANETIGLNSLMPHDAVAWLRARSEVAAVDTFREQTVRVRVRDAESQPVRLAAIQGEYRHNLKFLGGDAEQKMARVFAGHAIAITEPLSRRLRLRDGERLTLLSPRGAFEAEIAGTYSDYSRDQGIILMGRELFDRHWDEPGAQSLSVYLRPGASAAAVANAFRERFSREGEFAIYSNRELRTRILGIFEQTFAVTYVLRTVAVLVALAGIFLSVTTLVTERERETGVLRAIGASRAQIAGIFMTESGMIGAVATALGLAAGAVLAMVLTWVVNPAFFGWTIALEFPWSILGAIPLWIIPAALLAAWFPARRVTRALIAESVREE